MIKKFIRGFLLHAVVAVAPLTLVAEGPQNVIIDSAASSVSWVGRKVTGSHSGTVAIKDGHVTLADGALQSGEFQVDIGQVVVKDIEDPKNNAKLVGHLKSPDFFSVEQFPLVTFKIKSASKLDTVGANGENTQVHGELTIKGLTQAVDFPAKVVISGNSAEASGAVHLDRTKWDIRYGSGKFFQGLGDKLIYDEFEVSFSVKGKLAS